MTVGGPGGSGCGWTTDPTSHASLTEAPGMWGRDDDDDDDYGLLLLTVDHFDWKMDWNC